MRSFLSIANAIALLATSVIAHPHAFIWDNPQALVRRGPTEDGTCGSKGAGTNGFSCLTTENKCCSEYGWCGDTEAHCGAGCQAEFGECGGVVNPPTNTTTTATDAPTNTQTNPTSTSTQEVETDFTCGPTYGNKRCRTGYCCSGYGFCGVEPAYCSITSGNCQPLFGECEGTGNPEEPTNGRCGPANGDQVCANNQCCSPEGYCGTGQYHCQSPDCLLGFGRCDADTVPPGASTLGGARALFGAVPFGADIFVCQEPGTLALTYDDGPYIYTPYVLDLLATYNAKATFFVTGINIGKGRIDDPALPWAAMISRMVAEGHQVASHGWSHADLSTLSETARENEMVRNEMAIRNIIGKWPTYMRPPYSSCNAACMVTMRTLGYHVIYFDFDTQDYLHTTPETQQISKDVVHALLQTKTSEQNWLSIMHDIHQQTAYNLTAYFLAEADTKGFRFVTVGECLGDPEANWYRTSNDEPSGNSTTTTTTTTTSTTETSTTETSTTETSTTETSTTDTSTTETSTTDTSTTETSTTETSTNETSTTETSTTDTSTTDTSTTDTSTTDTSTTDTSTTDTSTTDTSTTDTSTTDTSTTETSTTETSTTETSTTETSTTETSTTETSTTETSTTETSTTETSTTETTETSTTETSTTDTSTTETSTTETSTTETSTTTTSTTDTSTTSTTTSTTMTTPTTTTTTTTTSRSTTTTTTRTPTPTPTCTTYLTGQWCAKQIQAFNNRGQCNSAYKACHRDGEACIRARNVDYWTCVWYRDELCGSLSSFCDRSCRNNRNNRCTRAQWEYENRNRW